MVSTNLFDDKTTETMSYKNDRPGPRFLFHICQESVRTPLLYTRTELYLRYIPIPYKPIQKVVCMVFDALEGNIPCNVRVVTKYQDTAVWYVLGQEIPGP